MQGDARCDCIDSEFVAFLFNSNALTLEKINLNNFIVDQMFLSDIPGPQRRQKVLGGAVLENFGYNFLGFEKNIDWGIVDILAEDKKGDLIAVECEPCRLSKLINYFRLVHMSELWIVSGYYNESFLFIVRG